MDRIVRSLTIIICAALLAACAAQGTPTAVPALEGVQAPIAPESRLIDRGIGVPAAGERAPEFSYTLADGTTVRLSDLRGKRVLVNFWATWCLPCREEMPLFEAALAREDDLVVLAVNRNETPAAIEDYAAETGVGLTLIADSNGAIGDRYAVTSLPITYFVNRDGTVSVRHFGAISATVLAQRIEDMQ
jgi:cytochrome c biogenesis protein CcmG, thiol:disulfide interchange protein DsbE